ncbi:MAG: sulfatase-like hydrolase/transferase [Planctomycetota bacterium]
MSQRLPNIVILYADDLGFGDLRCNDPQSMIPTPNMDRLAKEGLRFSDAHSSSGICTPSRYALLTGRSHWRDFHNIVGAMGDSVFKPEQTTLPEMLRTRGYQSAAIGKWHLGWDWSSIRLPAAKPTRQGRNAVWSFDDFDWSKPISDGPLDHGFDHYFGDTVINFPPYGWIEDARLTTPPTTMLDTATFPKIKEGKWECRAGPMVAGWNPYDVLPTLAERGVGYIREHARDDQPFFLYFAFPSPHAPIVPNDAFDGKSGAGPYGDFVFETDHRVGQLLDAIDDAGIADNTLVIFTADNGPERYAYAREEAFGHWSAAPFRGLKRDLYEGGHHVPMIVRWPRRIEAGRTVDALTSQTDVMATLATLTGATLPAGQAMDSVDQSSVWLADQPPVRPSMVHNTRANEYAFRNGEWVLLEAKSGYVSRRNRGWEARRGYSADDDNDVELFHLAEDIGQMRDLAKVEIKRVAAMKLSSQAERSRRPSPFALRRLPERVSIRGMAVAKPDKPSATRREEHLSAPESLPWVYVCGTQSTVLRSRDLGATWQDLSPRGFLDQALDFRSIAVIGDKVTIAVAGQPAVVLHSEDAGATWRSVYQIEHASGFIDGIQMVDDQRGYLFGDPVDGRWWIAETLDGGKSWSTLPESKRPLAPEGEAGFAASNSSIFVDQDKICIGTGGVTRDRARIWIGKRESTSAGRSSWIWTAANAPLQSSSRAGVFSIAADEDGTLIAVGGDYRPESEAVATAAISDDGGANWRLLTRAPRTFQSSVVSLSGGRWISVGNGADGLSKIHLGTDVDEWSEVPNPAQIFGQGFHVLAKGPNYVYAAGADGQFAFAKIDDLSDG